MSKSQKHQIFGLYTPHARVQADNTIVNLHTGEITIPPPRTKQSFLPQCDINNIIKEFSITGQITHVSAQAARGAYLDLPEVMDYQESLNTLQRASEAFQSLPAKVRDRFGNDPAQFLEFCGNPENRNEMGELGLLGPYWDRKVQPGGDGGTPPSLSTPPDAKTS
ncbi:MAG: internal scaffolding protein [Microviridae sp.]|nr:MAG: internal scaffolding protein [Microviridae sp.]